MKYIASQRAATGIVPDDKNIVIEQFRDETGAVRIVIHAAFGGRINAPWGMALAQRVREPSITPIFRYRRRTTESCCVFPIWE